MKAGQSEEDANAYVEANKEAIEKDPEAFVKENLPDAAEPLKQEADKFIKNAEEKGVEVSEGVTMTVEQLTQQQLDSATNQAATGMTTGVINYWEGTQFGAFGMGTSVCLGYSRAFHILCSAWIKIFILKIQVKVMTARKLLQQMMVQLQKYVITGRQPKNCTMVQMVRHWISMQATQLTL